MDISKIKKRDGRMVPFQKEKITKAIFKAAQAVGGEDYDLAMALTEKVVEIAQYVNEDQIATVEDIQDLVEKVLVKNGHYKTAKAYILYRKQHENIRETSQLLFNNKLIADYLERNDWRIKENSNMTYSLQGMNFHISSLLVSPSFSKLGLRLIILLPPLLPQLLYRFWHDFKDIRLNFLYVDHPDLLDKCGALQGHLL
jgi:anaerobic ribonucleoside-triphosphate reductase